MNDRLRICSNVFYGTLQEEDFLRVWNDLGRKKVKCISVVVVVRSYIHASKCVMLLPLRLGSTKLFIYAQDLFVQVIHMQKKFT